MIASAPYVVAYQLEIRNVGIEASGHVSDAFATNPGFAAIYDDTPMRSIKGRNRFR